MSFQAEPFEKAGLSTGAGDKRGNEFPALIDIVYVCDWEAILFAMLADEPN